MSLIKLRARVCMPSEGQLETEGKYDLGNIAGTKEWVWTNTSVLASEVYRIWEYKKNRTIVQMYDGEKILVSETYAGVHEKWEEAITEEGIEFEPDEEEETAEEEDDEED